MIKKLEFKKRKLNKSDLKILDIYDCKLTDLNIEDIIPNVIDNVLVAILDGNTSIILPKDMTGEKYKNWMKGKGGIFFKDIKNYVLNKDKSKYILLEKDNKKCIIRLIKDEEHLKFESLKLIDGIIKDLPYMILLDGINKLTSSNINYNEDIIMEENLNNQNFFPNKNPVSLEDVEYHFESISLFEN